MVKIDPRGDLVTVKIYPAINGVSVYVESNGGIKQFEYVFTDYKEFCELMDDLFTNSKKKGAE